MAKFGETRGEVGKSGVLEQDKCGNKTGAPGNSYNPGAPYFIPTLVFLGNDLCYQ